MTTNSGHWLLAVVVVDCVAVAMAVINSLNGGEGSVDNRSKPKEEYYPLTSFLILPISDLDGGEGNVDNRSKPKEEYYPLIRYLILSISDLS